MRPRQLLGVPTVSGQKPTKTNALLRAVLGLYVSAPKQIFGLSVQKFPFIEATPGGQRESLPPLLNTWPARVLERLAAVENQGGTHIDLGSDVFR